MEMEEEGYRSGFSGRADEGGVDWSGEAGPDTV